MVSVTKVPFGLDELAVVGGIAGEPLEVVKCETSDVLVPAHAEIVIEGELRGDYEIPNPAMGEHLGHIVLHKMLFPFEVKCITHRADPIWHDYISQMPPSESSTIRGIGSEGSMLSFLKNDCGIPQVKDVAFHHCAGAWRLCVIRLHDIGGVRTHNGIVWQALNASLSISPDWPKIVIAVDEDIDPWDLESVFWAVTCRYQPHRDSRIVQGRTAGLDQSPVPYLAEEEEDDRFRFPTSMSGLQGASAQLMDATRKWDYTPVALPKREYMERARQLWEELGFPRLNPKAPWFGYSLGVWSADYQRQAELAEKGEFDQVAEMLLAKAKR
jgi:4-hydroxy-3-polyprenylbenzoate decarboxylase